MVKDVAGLRVNEKANGIKSKFRNSINGTAKVAVKGSPEKVGTNGRIHDDHTWKGTPTVEKIIDAEAGNLSGMTLGSTFETVAAFSAIGINGAEKKLEPKLQVAATKQRYHVIKSHYDEEDNWSLASSATSIHTKVTVPVAPKFTCVDRLERRKEFYTKLEEKHRALEKEKHDYEARVKEEEEAAIKLLRKNMSYKANPVPSFYREGPPAKVELKKLPVTRAKSPNLTRRKSCGDAVTKATPESIHCGRATRHSIGSTKEAKASPMSSKSKAQNGSPTPNGSIKVRSRPRQIKETIKMSGGEGKSNPDIAAES